MTAVAVVSTLASLCPSLGMIFLIQSHGFGSHGEWQIMLQPQEKSG